MDLGATANHLLANYGYLAVFMLPLLESTGVPVPGETMLLTAAEYAATTGRLNIAAGYLGGRGRGDPQGQLRLPGRAPGRSPPGATLRPVHPCVTERHLRVGERFFERHTNKTVFLARFIAVLRTIGAFVAGASKMHYRTFLVWECRVRIT